MHGNLSEQTAADVLGKIQGLEASGVLRVENGKTIRQLFIDSGAVIRFAASNLPAEGLTSLLKQKAGVTDDHLRQATAAKKQNELLGTALVRLGVLERALLAELTQEHVRHVLRAILTLKDGRFRFQAGDLPFRDQIDGGRSIAELLLQWGREAADPVEIRFRLGTPESFVRRASTSPAGLRDVPLDAAEGYALSRLDVPTSLRDLCTLSPLPEEATLRAIYALRLAGIVKIVAPDEATRPAPRIVGPRPVIQPSPASAAERQPLRRSAAGALDERLKPAATSASSPGAAPSAPQTAAAPQTAPAPPLGTEPLAHAGRATETSPGAQETTPPQSPTAAGAGQLEMVRPLSDLERQMLARFEQLHDQSMYEVLGIQSNVGTTDVRRAYYALARTLHPDKFRHDDMKSKAEKVFARITEAYSTLSHAAMRGKYDEELARRSGKDRDDPQVDPAVMARLNFNRGKEYYDKGKYPQALSFFANACQQDAAKGAYFQYLGMTQAHNPRLRKQAAQSLLKAMELDPTSAEPYAQLGSLYVRMGQTARGQEMYRKALQWDGSNQEALRGLGDDARQEEKRGFLGMFGKKKSAAS